MFHNVNGDIRVLEDINSLTSISDEKGADFQSNQTIRVCDQIANDVAVMFATRYLGVVPNDASGRVSLWNDICKLHQDLETMASIKSQLVLTDGMTGPLKSINKALNLVLSSFEATQRASGRAINTASIASARAELGRANAQIEEMEHNLQDCGNQQDNLNKRISTGTNKANGLLSKIKSVATAYLGMKGINIMTNLSDTLTSNEARLSLIVDDGGSVEELQKKIYVYQ